MQNVSLIVLLDNWAIFFFLLGVFFWWLLCEFFLHIWLSLKLKRLGYPLLHKFRFFSLRERWLVFKDKRYIGGHWLMRKRHYWVLSVSFLLIFASCIRAIKAQSATEFSRGGALVVMAGILSLIFGYYEAQSIKKTLRNETQNSKIIVKRIVSDLLSDHIDDAQFNAAIKSAIVSIIGTFVWGYGDQIMVCGKFIDDANVYCGKKVGKDLFSSFFEPDSTQNSQAHKGIPGHISSLPNANKN